VGYKSFAMDSSCNPPPPRIDLSRSVVVGSLATAVVLDRTPG
jgi:hypothetical protein